MELWIGAAILGILYSFMTLGVFITFRVYDFPDITVDGSFTSGAAVAAILIISGYNLFFSIAAAFAAGAAAGAITGIIHTRLKIDGLLAGILVMTGLYSVNLHIMGRSNIPLLNQLTIFSDIEKINPGFISEVWVFIALSLCMFIFAVVLSLFFKTDIGIAMRITGNNPVMAAANGVNVKRMKIFGIALANGFVGVSGGLVAQYQGFADIGMGIGTIVVGFASVIIGEAVFRSRSMYIIVFGVIIGSIIFRFMIALALYLGMNPIDLKLLTAAFVLLTLIISKNFSCSGSSFSKTIKRLMALIKKRIKIICMSAAFLAIAIFSAYIAFTGLSTQKKLALFYFSDHPIVDSAISGVLDELKSLGILEERDLKIDKMCAQNEFYIAQSIVQDIVNKKYDYIISLSTPALQVTAQINKQIPHVFGMVTDPFRMGIAKKLQEHIPNITGVATMQPVESLIKAIREVIPDSERIGIVWNASEACSEACTLKARAAVEKYGFELVEANVTGTSEVIDAVRSVLNRGVDVFITSGDNTVIVALESVSGILKERRIPYFTNDPTDVDRGAVIGIGADYYEVGKETAKIAVRVIMGENPKEIPIKEIVPEKIHVNISVAEDIGLHINEAFLKKADRIVR